MASTLPGETGRLSDVLADASLLIIAKLFKNAIDVDKQQLTVADFTEADFPGYAPVVAGGWGMCESDVEEVGEAVSDPVAFATAGITVPQTIYGVYVVSSYAGAPEKLVNLMLFPLPITLTDISQEVAVQLRVTSVNFPGS